MFPHQGNKLWYGKVGNDISEELILREILHKCVVVKAGRLKRGVEKTDMGILRMGFYHQEMLQKLNAWTKD